MKCYNSTFNAQGSRVTIGVVLVGAVKIYGAEVKALRKKERQDESELTAKIGGKNCLDPSLFRFVKFSFPVDR